MLILLSPSKSVTHKAPPIKKLQTDLLFPDETKILVTSLQKLSKNKLANTLKVSKPLAEVNYKRYKTWISTETRSALWLYSGDVYNGLDAFSMNEQNVCYAQKYIMIISGLYGLVRPLDGIRPYRLEMKLAHKGPWGANLYEAWGKKIADTIHDTNESTILMCASKEYAKAVTLYLDKNIRIITPRFMQETEDGLKEKGLFAKYARGALARYAVDNSLQSSSELQNYSSDGFSFSKDLSTETEYVYIVPKDFSLKGRFVKQ